MKKRKLLALLSLVLLLSAGFSRAPSSCSAQTTGDELRFAQYQAGESEVLNENSYRSLRTPTLGLRGIVEISVLLLLLLSLLVYALVKLVQWIFTSEEERLVRRWEKRKARALRKSIIAKSIKAVDLLGDGKILSRTRRGKTYEIEKMADEFVRDRYEVRIYVNGELVFHGSREKNIFRDLGEEYRHHLKKYVVGGWEKMVARLSREASHSWARSRQTEFAEVKEQAIKDLKQKMGEN